MIHRVVSRLDAFELGQDSSVPRDGILLSWRYSSNTLCL